MISNLTEQNSKDNSFGTRLDPRSKIIFIIFFIANVLMLQSNNLPQVIIVLVILAIMINFSGYSLLFFIRKILKIYPMIFFTTFLLPFTNMVHVTGINDTILVDMGEISIYKYGLIRFFDFNLKSILILVSTLVLTVTTSYSILLKGMESINMPLWLLSVLTYMFRFIYLLSTELEKMHMAFTSRHISLPYFKKIKIFAQMVAVYFVRIIEHSERTYIAMISRGFSGRYPIYNELTWHLYDSFIVSAGFIFTIAMILI